MTWKAKIDILRFKKGQVVEEIQDNWKPYFEKVEDKPKPVELKIEEKVEPVEKKSKSKKSKR